MNCTNSYMDQLLRYIDHQSLPLHHHNNHQQDLHQSHFLPHDEDCVGRPWAVTRVSLAACLRVSRYKLLTYYAIAWKASSLWPWPQY